MILDDEIPVFTILVVDDTPEAIETEKTQISNYLKSKGLKLEWIIDEKGKNVLDILKKQNVDVVAIDNNIGQSIGGLSIIKKIRVRDDLIDILYYSAQKGSLPDLDKAKFYVFTEIVKSKNIAPTMNKIIEKNLSKWDDVHILRGIIISKTIDIEQRMNKILLKYFAIPKHRKDNFNDFVLGNKSVTFESKKSALLKVLEITELSKKFQLSNKLQEMQESRNILAHCTIHPVQKNHFIHMGSAKPYGKKQLNDILQQSKTVAIMLNEIELELQKPDIKKKTFVLQSL